MHHVLRAVCLYKFTFGVDSSDISLLFLGDDNEIGIVWGKFDGESGGHARVEFMNHYIDGVGEAWREGELLEAVLIIRDHDIGNIDIETCCREGGVDITKATIDGCELCCSCLKDCTVLRVIAKIDFVVVDKGVQEAEVRVLCLGIGSEEQSEIQEGIVHWLVGFDEGIEECGTFPVKVLGNLLKVGGFCCFFDDVGGRENNIEDKDDNQR